MKTLGKGGGREIKDMRKVKEMLGWGGFR